MKLNNIIRIERTSASSLEVDRISLEEVIVPDNVVWSKIDCVTPVKVESTEKDDRKSSIYTIKVTLQLNKEEKWRGIPGMYAFKLTSVDGNSYLIGMPERPYPIIESSNVHPAKVSESQGRTIAIEYQSTFDIPLIKE